MYFYVPIQRIYFPISLTISASLFVIDRNRALLLDIPAKETKYNQGFKYLINQYQCVSRFLEAQEL